MKIPFIHSSLPFVILASLMTPSFGEVANEPPTPEVAADVRPLKIDTKNILSVRQFRIGFGDTLVFIPIPEQHAVIQLRIDHTRPEFPVVGRISLFAEGTDGEALAKWINNQHSCALHMDVPKPVFTGSLPDGGIVVVESEKIGEAAGHLDGAPYHDYRVKLAVAAHAEPGQYALEAFEMETNVYLKL